MKVTSQDRQFRLDRHQRLTTLLAQIKDLYDQILLPESSPRERIEELKRVVDEIPEDARTVAAFMILLDDLKIELGEDEDRFIRICQTFNFLIQNHASAFLEVISRGNIRFRSKKNR